MLIQDFVLYVSLVIFVLYITRINNFWGVSKGTKKAKEDVKVEKSTQKKRKRTLWLLSQFEWVSNNIGFSLNEFKTKEYKYKIDRLDMKVNVLNRNIKPIELVGILKVIQLLSTFLMVAGFVVTGSIVPILLGIPIFAPVLFGAYASARISSEDEKIEQEFPDLFLILYSRLLQGTKTRLAPTLKDFLLSLDSISTKDKSKELIRKFVVDLRNNIEIYGDDSMAVRKLTEKYTSVTVINFCNLAVQALNGVDNSDKLLAFKLELSTKRVDQMKKRADKLVAKGSRAVLIVYVILFQFVVLSWVAKLSQAGGVGKIFGL